MEGLKGNNNKSKICDNLTLFWVEIRGFIAYDNRAQG